MKETFLSSEENARNFACQYALLLGVGTGVGLHTKKKTKNDAKT